MSQDFATPSPTLAAGTTHAGFTVERAEPLPEISGCAYVMRHDATGARVMWLACADSNTGTSIWKGGAYSSSVVGRGLSSRRRRKISERMVLFTFHWSG